MEDYSKPHDESAPRGLYDYDKMESGLGSLVEGFERAADQMKGQQIIHMPGMLGVDSVTVALPAPEAESIDYLTDAVRAVVAGDDELATDILLSVKSEDTQTLAFYINKLGAMLIARSSVDMIEGMIEANRAKEKK